MMTALRGKAQGWSGVLSRFMNRKSASPRQTPDFALVRRPTHLQDITKVERHLPELLGRALARAWIDAEFNATFLADPKGLLARYGVHLPATVSIEVETTQSQRQRIVVYEHRQGEPKRRVMYLQLVMMAGK